MGPTRVGYNSRIKVRDQLKCPGPAEVKVMMAQCQKEGGFCFCLKGDVRKAHRIPRVRASDHRYQL